MALVAAAGCEPLPLEPPRFGLDACNVYLLGSPVLADIDAAGTPIVCELQLPGAPASAEGWWDGQTIHVWPATAGEDGRYVLKIAAHEYGHSIASAHPDWLASWTAARNASNGSEDFAESWAYCNYPDPTSGYLFHADHAPTDDECAVMHDWHRA